MAAPIIPTVSSVKYSVDLKANGEVSRMRNHKGQSSSRLNVIIPLIVLCTAGNMPSLPQTKYCSLCPAKFTRTTHLNRHLRSRACRSTLNA